LFLLVLWRFRNNPSLLFVGINQDLGLNELFLQNAMKENSKKKGTWFLRVRGHHLAFKLMCWPPEVK